MIERSPDPHFTQTQNTNRVSSNSQLSKLPEGFFLVLCCVGFLFVYLFSQGAFFGFAIETTILLAPEGGKKKLFFIKLKQMAFLLVKNI